MQDGYQVSFLFLPDGEDPDTMVKKVGKDAFEQLINDATPLTDFLINTLQQQADVTRLDGRAKLSKLAKPMIEQFPDGVLKTLVVQRLARLTEIAPQDLQNKPPAQTTQNTKKETKWEKNKQGKWRPARQPEPSATTMPPVRRTISLILQYPELAELSSTLQSIPADSIRGMDLIHGLLSASIGGASYFSTLTQLANHRHNDMESLSVEEATDLINATNEKIINEYNQNQLRKVEQELQRLSNKASVNELSPEEKTKRDQLIQIIRDNLR